MKKLFFTTIIAFATLALNAQVKVLSGGSTLVGSTTPTVTTSGIKLQVLGNSLFSTVIGTTSASAPLIVATSTFSSVSAPDYTWNGNTTTGFYHPSSNNISVAINGVQTGQFVSGGGYLYGNFYFPYNATGTLTSCALIRGSLGYSGYTTPDFSWYGDITTGMFHPAANKIAFSTNGAERFRLTDYGLLIGTTTDPQYVELLVQAKSGYRALQTSSTFTYDGGTHEQITVNRAGTHAIMLFNSATSTVTPVFYVEGTGDVTGKSFTSTSDKNFKENIDTLRSALNKINQLQGVTYNFKTSVTGLTVNKKEMGLLAQDVEIVAPEVVYTSDKGIKSIAYGNLTALCIEAIKEQNKIIKQLQSDMNACCSKTGQKTTQNNSDDGRTTILNGGAIGNDVAKLWQNNPNPFSQTTSIKCFIPEQSKTASLLIFDLTGALKKTISINGKGEVNVTINAREFIAGMYNYTLIIDGQEIDTKKMILTEQ